MGTKSRVRKLREQEQRDRVRKRRAKHKKEMGKG